MKIIQTIAAMILSGLIFIGCSATGRVQENGGSSLKSHEQKSVSVSLFTCSNPGTAQDVQNAIIGSLLDSYSVTTGGEAGVVINGAIILTGDAVSPESSESNISAIKATVLINNKIAESVTLTRADAALSSDTSPEAMGRKLGMKIKDILSR
jgi:hypothetical protein